MAVVSVGRVLEVVAGDSFLWWWLCAAMAVEGVPVILYVFNSTYVIFCLRFYRLLLLVLLHTLLIAMKNSRDDTKDDDYYDVNAMGFSACDAHCSTCTVLLVTKNVDLVCSCG